jgi:hypothetical protein
MKPLGAVRPAVLLHPTILDTLLLPFTFSHTSELTTRVVQDAGKKGNRMRFEAGTVFAGYTVESRLGRGGMATVYLVREPGIDRLVALKVLPEQLVDDSQFAARFEQEARVIGGLDHPNIIPLYRYGITDDVPWMALRYVDGGDLASRLTASPLPVPAGLAILRGVADALDYAHGKSVIHRDLKPQNILLTGSGAAYLADFGVAKLLEGTLRLKTATGNVMGTPAYMAPEQAKGEPIGPYTDVYALAVICFQWLTGSLPFDADTPHAILMKHVLTPVPAEALQMLAPSVAAVLERGLAKDPADRFQSASTLVSQLEHALYSPATRSLPAASTPKPRANPSVRSEPRPQAAVASQGSNRLWKVVALTALVMALAIGGYAYWREVLQPAAEQRAAQQHAADEAAAKQAAEAASAKQTADVTAAKLAAEKSNAEKRAADEAATKQVADKLAADKRAADEATAKQVEATQATLIVKADAACQLTVNGEAKGALQANKAKTFKLNPGEQLIECTSGEDSGIKAQQTKSVAAGAQAVVGLALAEKLADKQQEAQQQRAAADSAARERAAAEATARDPGNAGFIDLGNGVLKDTKTGLQWTQNDNGNEIDWNDAKSYCESKAGGWRLPSQDELAAIYDANVPTPKVCLVYRDHGETKNASCKTSVLFHLTANEFWSGTQDGAENALGVFLTDGTRGQFGKSYTYRLRALCARRS